MSGGPKMPSIRLDNIWNAATDVSTAAIRWGANVVDYAYSNVKGPLSESVGIESERQRSEREKNEAASAETAARASFYNDAISNRTLDATTRAEIEGLYNSGASSATIAAALTAAGEGKGIYGIRRANANEQAIAMAQPGRAQLTPTLGFSSPLGSAMKTGGSR